MIASIGEIYGSRDLLRSFLVRDLQVRYKASALGVMWSLLNPVFMMLVYTVVFSVIVRAGAAGINNYPVWFLAGFLRGTANNRQASSYASTATRLDVRRLQVPRMPPADQVQSANSLVRIGAPDRL